MLVRELMRKEFISVDADQSLLYLIKLLAKNKIHEVPVLKDDLFIGLISDTEISNAIIKKFFLKKPILKDRALYETIKAIDIVNKRYFYLKPDDHLIDVIQDMGKRSINIIPVLQDKKLVGIITGMDLINHLALDIAKQTIQEVDSSTVRSIVDSFLVLVREKKRINISKLAKELKIRREKAEEIAKALEDHHLVEIEYSISGNMVVRDKNAG